MNLNDLLRDYFTFSRKERIGLLAIIILIIAIWLSPKLISSGSSGLSPDKTWVEAVRKLEHKETDSKKNITETAENTDTISSDKLLPDQPAPLSRLFYFDPNNLSPDGWKKLGIHEKTVATIQKYLSKGGHFFKAEDLKRIYGIRAGEYAMLAPYIRIEEKSYHADQYPKTEYKKDQSVSRPIPIDINIADTSAFISLPGIGNKLASRIVSFREKLGGFYSIDQISEIYGLPDSTFKKIKSLLQLGTVALKKLNINSATKDELKTHPYIKWNIANAIVEYRNQHGNFSSLEDLKKISIITDDVFGKIKSYLSF